MIKKKTFSTTKDVFNRGQRSATERNMILTTYVTKG